MTPWGAGEIVGVVLTAVVVVLFVFAFLAPLDSLRWWDRRGADAGSEVVLVPQHSDPLPGQEPSDAFLVYLSGIAAITGTYDNVSEREFLADLADVLPSVTIAADVFPYSVAGVGLTQRRSAWFWGKLADWQRNSSLLLAKGISGLVQVRNAFRVMVSADPRYGPTFNLGVAQQIIDSLSRHGYDWTRRPPVVILGYSGGGQVAIGAAWYLGAVGLDVSVISLAGVLNSDPGIARLSRLWHFYGRKDGTRPLGPVIFPGRWPVSRTSRWNQAKREGRITAACLGPMKHAEGRDYFDAQAVDEQGVSFRTLTIRAVSRAISETVER